MKMIFKILGVILLVVLAMIVFPVKIVGIVGLFVAWVGAIFFPFYYHFTTRWQHNPIGPHLMGYSAAVALSLTNTVARVMWPNLPWRIEAGTILMWIIVWVIYWRIFVFMKIKREFRRNKANSPPAGDATHLFKAP